MLNKRPISSTLTTGISPRLLRGDPRCNFCIFSAIHPPSNHKRHYAFTIENHSFSPIINFTPYLSGQSKYHPKWDEAPTMGKGIARRLES